jgi:hypothetical protein
MADKCFQVLFELILTFDALVILVALVKIQRSVSVKPGLTTNRKLMVLHVTLLIFILIDGSLTIFST